MVVNGIQGIGVSDLLERRRPSQPDLSPGQQPSSNDGGAAQVEGRTTVGSISLSFSVDSVTHEVTIQVLDEKGKVIRQVPLEFGMRGNILDVIG